MTKKLKKHERFREMERKIELLRTEVKGWKQNFVEVKDIALSERPPKHGKMVTFARLAVVAISLMAAGITMEGYFRPQPKSKEEEERDEFAKEMREFREFLSQKGGRFKP